MFKSEGFVVRRVLTEFPPPGFLGSEVVRLIPVAISAGSQNLTMEEGTAPAAGGSKLEKVQAGPQGFESQQLHKQTMRAKPQICESLFRFATPRSIE